MVPMPNEKMADFTENIIEDRRIFTRRITTISRTYRRGRRRESMLKRMDWDEKSKLRIKAAELTGSDEPGFMLQDKGQRFKKALNRYKKLIGKASKALPMLQLLDIFTMKDEYDQIMEGEHPILNQMPGFGGDLPTAAKGGIIALKKA